MIQDEGECSRSDEICLTGLDIMLEVPEWSTADCEGSMSYSLELEEGKIMRRI